MMVCHDPNMMNIIQLCIPWIIQIRRFTYWTLNLPNTDRAVIFDFFKTPPYIINY